LLGVPIEFKSLGSTLGDEDMEGHTGQVQGRRGGRRTTFLDTTTQRMKEKAKKRKRQQDEGKNKR